MFSNMHKSGLKIKLKISGHVFAEKSLESKVSESSPYAETYDDESEERDLDDDENSSNMVLSVGDDVSTVGDDISGVGDDTSDEEREWLEALESGTLDDYGMLKRSRDPATMTARQKALLHGVNEVDLLELPSGYRTTELTDEQLQRRQQKATKRRQQAHEKREKDKKLTVDRLLKKQEAKLKRRKIKDLGKCMKPRYAYRNGVDLVTISCPLGYQFPYPSKSATEYPKKQLCGVDNCTNFKKYSCSKTGIPLCSLECYKKNLLKIS